MFDPASLLIGSAIALAGGSVSWTVEVAAADTNWFYSTLSQSTAALVGLAGAFLLQRLIAQRQEVGPRRQHIRQGAADLLGTFVVPELEEVRAARENLDDLVIEAKALRAAGDPVGWRHRNLLLLHADGTRSELDKLVPEDGFDGLVVLEEAQRVLAAYECALAHATWSKVTESLRTTGRLPPFEASAVSLDAQAQEIPSGHTDWLSLRSQACVVERRWALLDVNARLVGSELEDLRAGLVPRTFWVLLAILLFLVVVGVIVPLSYLSAEPGTSKAVLYWLFAGGALSFVAYFGWELWRLRRADRLEDRDF